MYIRGFNKITWKKIKAEDKKNVLNYYMFIIWDIERFDKKMFLFFLTEKIVSRRKKNIVRVCKEKKICSLTL